jgi:surface antigen
MKSDLLKFIDSYLGKAGTGDTPGNRGQCVGLIEVWADVNSHPHIAGNAVDLYRNADPAAYTKVANAPLNYPPAGAIVCWDGSWGGGYGHTAIVVAASSMQLVVFEQNDPLGASPLVATHSYAGVQGWLILK